jgi:hypothetical protein
VTMVKNPSPVRGRTAVLRLAGMGSDHARAAGGRGFTGKNARSTTRERG